MHGSFLLARSRAAEGTEKPVNNAPVEPPRLRQVLKTGDLVALSVSSVGPLFSIAATGGVMARSAGWWSLVAISFVSVPFIISAFVFRLLSRHFPHAGASYHWAARVMGARPARLQAWILVLAYFSSIPPIIIPASTYTIAILAPGISPPSWLSVVVGAGWVGFSLVPLLRGAIPTAKVTKAFLAIEILSVAGLIALAVARWHAIGVPVHFGQPRFGGMAVVAVVAATVLDGWEIDSYAAEEAAKPGRDLGLGGIAGAFIALGFYAVLYPLMFAETPMSVLSSTANPMASWAGRLLPAAPSLVLIPVLASTAGGMWLTSYILSRALFAMGREGLLPSGLARLNSRGAPAVATVAILATAFVVTALQLLYHSLESFFALVLSAAGFLLVSEFFLDSLTATVFLRRIHRSMPTDIHSTHHHRSLLVASSVSTLLFASLLAAFVTFGPAVIGSSIDLVVGVIVAGGLVFAFSRRNVLSDRTGSDPKTMIVGPTGHEDRSCADGAA